MIRGTPPVLVLERRRLDSGRVELRSPAVGLWRGAPSVGHAVTGGDRLGELDVLGVLHVLRTPGDVHGAVVAIGVGMSRAAKPVGHGDVLLVLEPLGARREAETSAQLASASEAALVLRAPTSGRFYRRPGPEKPAFVEVGAIVSPGRTVGLIEVMKTFNRMLYGGAGLPERARVRAVVPADGDDIAQGAVVLELEPIE